MKQTIDKLRDAESRAVKAEQEAKQKAKSIVSEAHEKSAKMLKDAQQQYKQTSDGKIELVKKECEKELSEIKKKSDSDSAKLIAQAEKNYEKVFEAVKNAGELIRLGAGAVKIEGGFDYIIDTIKQMTKSGIPVMGHLGFTPQYINVLGGHFVQGKNLKNTIEILEAAKKIQDAGAFSLVLEMVPDVCAKYISENLEIPVIGIGAGKYTDGQILVVDDVLGKFDGFSPKFVRKYADIKTTIKNAVSSYVKDVKEQTFPEINESFQLKEDEYEEFESYINKERTKVLS